MPVTYDPIENKIWFNGQTIGSLTEAKGRYGLNMAIEYNFKNGEQRAEFLVALSTVIDKYEDSENTYLLSWDCTESDVRPVETELQLLEAVSYTHLTLPTTPYV